MLNNSISFIAHGAFYNLSKLRELHIIKNPVKQFDLRFLAQLQYVSHFQTDIVNILCYVKNGSIPFNSGSQNLCININFSDIYLLCTLAIIIVLSNILPIIVNFLIKDSKFLSQLLQSMEFSHILLSIYFVILLDVNTALTKITVINNIYDSWECYLAALLFFISFTVPIICGVVYEGFHLYIVCMTFVSHHSEYTVLAHFIIWILSTLTAVFSSGFQPLQPEVCLPIVLKNLAILPFYTAFSMICNIITCILRWKIVNITKNSRKAAGRIEKKSEKHLQIRQLMSLVCNTILYLYIGVIFSMLSFYHSKTKMFLNTMYAALVILYTINTTLHTYLTKHFRKMFYLKKLKFKYCSCSSSHAAQIGLCTKMYFQIWCNFCKFVGFIYFRM